MSIIREDDTVARRCGSKIRGLWCSDSSFYRGSTTPAVKEAHIHGCLSAMTVHYYLIRLSVGDVDSVNPMSAARKSREAGMQYKSVTDQRVDNLSASKILAESHTKTRH